MTNQYKRFIRICVVCIAVFFLHAETDIAAVVVDGNNATTVTTATYNSDLTFNQTLNKFSNAYNIKRTIYFSVQGNFNYSSLQIKGNRESFKSYTADTVKSYLTANNDNTFTIVEKTPSGIWIETFDKNFVCTSQRQLSLDAKAIFGGFFFGSEYVFLIEGFSNPQKRNKAEVVRVIRYTKDFQKIDFVSLYGNNTAIPFDAGSVRVAEGNGILYVHTCHQMYSGHQANFTFNIDIQNMKITFCRSDVSNTKTGYVSHSFNQFVIFDADRNLPVYLDHGDAYPRAIFLARPLANDPRMTDRKTLLRIAGSIGDNFTNTTVGGFENGSTKYIAVWTYPKNKRINVFASLISKNDIQVTKNVEISTYTEKESTEGSTPHLIPIGNGTFAVMWQEMIKKGETSNTIRYVLIDEEGNTLSEIKSTEAILSDCKPIVNNGNLLWYVCDGKKRIFYQLPIVL